MTLKNFEDEFLTEEEVLRFLALSAKRLANMRCEGTAPKEISRGKVRRYPKKEFYAWYLSKDMGGSSHKRAS